MKTTVDLPDKLLHQIKLRAVKSGRKLKDVIAELLRSGLAASSQRSAPARPPVIRTHSRTGLPYIECAPDAPARRMTADEIIALEEQAQVQEALERLGVSR